MTTSDYDIESAESLWQHAIKLYGNSLSDIVENLPNNLYSVKNKGKVGLAVEEHFYKYNPGNAAHVADFEIAGVELKATGVIRKTRNGIPYAAKERLVLTMINYMALVDEDWETSSLIKKCGVMLILFYLYEKDVSITDLKFVLPPILWNMLERDAEIIKQDWEKIKQKVYDGKAHELSEGDTFYLGACRKGSGGTAEPLRRQPFSEIGAKARAFSLKQSYVNTMIEASFNSRAGDVLITNENAAREGIEQVVLSKFRGLEGLSINEISEKYNFNRLPGSSKSFYRDLTMRILGIKGKRIPEFEKAGITMKTIRLEHTGIPRESMSFPAFKLDDFTDVVWEKSNFYDILNSKFFFIVFQYDANRTLRFKKATFWNMPYRDMSDAQDVWELTKSSILNSTPSNLPKSSFNGVAHVRPHGRNSQDVFTLPNGNDFPKQCFWLNARYIADQVK